MSAEESQNDICLFSWVAAGCDGVSSFGQLVAHTLKTTGKAACEVLSHKMTYFDIHIYDNYMILKPGMQCRTNI